VEDEVFNKMDDNMAQPKQTYEEKMRDSASSVPENGTKEKKSRVPVLYLSQRDAPKVNPKAKRLGQQRKRAPQRRRMAWMDRTIAPAPDL
jgi:hypothetical protein